MASSYSTDLKLELMVTGENAGTWGDKTNTNLNLIQQAIAGFESIALTSTNTTLSMTNAAISDARNAVLKFTGTITANCTVFVASGIEKTYILENGTTGNFTVALNQVGGASAIFSGTDKSSKLVYLNGTDVVDLGLVNLQGTQTLTNKTLTSPTINNGTANTIVLNTPIIDVIDDANEFTEQHQKKYIITFIPLQIVSFGLYYLCKKCKEPELGVLIGLFLNFEAIGITSYALMVHKYNRILARRRIYSNNSY